MKLLYCDVETTGTDHRRHGIIQISGIVEIDGEVKEEFDFRCQPFKGQKISDGALKVNNTTMEQIKSYRPPQEVYPQVLKIFDTYIDRYEKKDKFHFVGQNPRFDYDFMTEWFMNNGNKYFYAYVDYHLIDLISATAIFKMAGKVNVDNMKLETVAKWFNVKIQAHDSLSDIKATRELFYKYIELIKGIEETREKCEKCESDKGKTIDGRNWLCECGHLRIAEAKGWDDEDLEQSEVKQQEVGENEE